MKRKATLLIFAAALCVGSAMAQTESQYGNEVDSMLKRFVTYAGYRSSSNADFGMDSFVVTKGQRDMAQKVYDDLREIPGVEVRISSDFYVYARINGNISSNVPSICFTSHLDITPEVPDPRDGEWVMPQVHSNYDGGEIVLGNGIVLSPDRPEGKDLKGKKGNTIITSDGTSHLGGDCKAGVAILVEMARYYAENPKIKHGDIYLFFTQNEELGMSAMRFQSDFMGAVPDMLIDFDGGNPGRYSVENFSAINGTILFKGNMAHPSNGYYSGFADASTSASYWTAMMPPAIHPSNSKDREGYFQVYHRDDAGDSARLYFRMRYFEKSDSLKYASCMDSATQKTKRAYPRVEIGVESYSLVYDNIAYSMHPKTVQVIDNAAKTLNMQFVPLSQRSGTTSAMLASRGISGGPCLYSGQHSSHSLYEWVSIEELVQIKHLCEQIVREVAKL